MKIDFSKPILDQFGKTIADGDDVHTLRSVCATALFGTLQGDDSLSGVQKAKMGALGLRLFNGDEHDLQAEDIALLKERVGRTWSPLVVARAHTLLDPPEAAA